MALHLSLRQRLLTMFVVFWTGEHDKRFTERSKMLVSSLHTVSVTRLIISDWNQILVGPRVQANLR